MRGRALAGKNLPHGYSCENRTQDAEQRLTAVEYSGQKVPLFRRQLRFKQQLDKHDDAIQWRAKLVRHVCEEHAPRMRVLRCAGWLAQPCWRAQLRLRCQCLAVSSLCTSKGNVVAAAALLLCNCISGLENALKPALCHAVPA